MLKLEYELRSNGKSETEDLTVGVETIVEEMIEDSTETTEDGETTEEETTEVIKTEIINAGDSKETTEDVEMTEALVIGIVQNVTTQTLHSEPNVTVVVNLVQAVVDVDHAEITVEDLLDAMTVPKHLDEKMVEDRLDEMAETEGVRAAMKTEAHTVKNAQNVGRRSLEHLENHVAMAQVMHIIDLQNQSADVKMTTREGKQWVQNITTSMP